MTAKTRLKRQHKEVDRERLLRILDASLNEIYVFNPDTLVFEYVNVGAQRNLGYTLEQFRSMTPLDLKPEFTAVSFRQMIKPLQDHEEEVHLFETVHRRADGSLYPVEVHLQLIQQADEAVFLAVVFDIIERKQTEDEIKQQLEELQRWHDLTLDRETRSIELKREVNELLRRLKEPIRYPSVEA